jgi:hypothetical protein
MHFNMPLSCSVCSKTSPAFLAFILAGMAVPVHGWWDTGHEHITVGAIDHLPQPLRGFFQANLEEVRDRSGFEPPGRHYINIDLYPEFFAGTFPRDVNDLIAIYGDNWVTSAGKGPWTFANYVEQLSAAMAAAQTLEDWNNLLRIAAAQAHYIEDLHNPLHLTANYDGQLTDNDGIHARYEGAMIESHLGELTFAPAVAQYLPSVTDFVFDGIDEHYPYVADILAADDQFPQPYNTAYYDGLWAETGIFTQQLFQEASEAVASSWYTAWIDAGSPKTFLEYGADFNADGQVDSADLSEWKNAFGTGVSGDADGDGDSDGQDFLIWQREYGAGAGLTVASVAVPEPGAIAILVTTLLAKPRAGRRRPSCGRRATRGEIRR